MPQTTPAQERYTRFSYPNPQGLSAMVSAQAISPSGRSQGSTSTSNGCAVRPDSASSYRACKGDRHDVVHHTQQEYVQGEVQRIVRKYAANSVDYHPYSSGKRLSMLKGV